MKCPKCDKEIEPNLLHEWETGKDKATKIAFYECPECKVRFEQGINGKPEIECWIDDNNIAREFFEGKPQSTVKSYGQVLMNFCKFTNTTPIDQLYGDHSSYSDRLDFLVHTSI